MQGSDITYLPTSTGGLFINVPQKGRGNLGMGFYIEPEWVSNFSSIEYVTDRIAVIQFNIGALGKRTSRLTIVNVHQPSMAEETPQKKAAVHKHIKTLQKVYNRTRITANRSIIVGDFNAKVGKRPDKNLNYSILSPSKRPTTGRYTLGSRNAAGILLDNFLVHNELVAVNTCFKSNSRSRHTWTSPTAKTSNCIDYILMPRRELRMHFITSARTIGNKHTALKSDHVMVAVTVKLQSLLRCRKPNSTKRPSPDYDRFSTDKKIQSKYNQEVESMIRNSRVLSSGKISENPDRKYDEVTRILKKAGNACIPNATTLPNGQIDWAADEKMRDLAAAQIVAEKESKSSNGERYVETVRKIRRIKRSMKKRVKEIKNTAVNNMLVEAERRKFNRISYKLIASVNDPTNDAQHRQPFTLKEPNSQTIMHDKQALLDTATVYYTHILNEPGQDAPRSLTLHREGDEGSALEHPITTEEVHNASSRLNNHKATGNDSIRAELVKYTSENSSTKTIIAELLNSIFTNDSEQFTKGASFKRVGHSTMVLLNKPGKEKTIDNTRGISLENVPSKILETIFVMRAEPQVEARLLPQISGGRPGRGTEECTWTIACIKALAIKYGITFHMTIADIYKAYDSVPREEMLDAAATFLDKDTCRIARALLANTRFNIKLVTSGNIPAMSKECQSTRGFPQGGAASGMFFNIYMNHILESILPNLKQQVPMPTRFDVRRVTPLITSDMMYVDDLAMATTDIHQHVHANSILAAELVPFKVTVAPAKTKSLEISRANAKLVGEKYLGSIIGDLQEVKVRIGRAIGEFQQKRVLWSKISKLSLSARVRVFRVYIEPVLRFGMGNAALPKKVLEELNIVHRKLLRRVLRIPQTAHLRNEDLYARTKCIPLEEELTKDRWRNFGSALALGNKDENTPAYKMFHQLIGFQEEYPLFNRRAAGGPSIDNRSMTILSMIQTDLATFNSTSNVKYQLNTVADLTDMRDLAVHHRAKFNEILKHILKKSAQQRTSPTIPTIRFILRNPQEGEAHNAGGLIQQRTPTPPPSSPPSHTPPLNSPEPNIAVRTSRPNALESGGSGNSGEEEGEHDTAGVRASAATVDISSGVGRVSGGGHGEGDINATQGRTQQQQIAHVTVIHQLRNSQITITNNTQNNRQQPSSSNLIFTSRRHSTSQQQSENPPGTITDVRTTRQYTTESGGGTLTDGGNDATTSHTASRGASHNAGGESSGGQGGDSADPSQHQEKQQEHQQYQHHQQQQHQYSPLHTSPALPNLPGVPTSRHSALESGAGGQEEKERENIEESRRLTEFEEGSTRRGGRRESHYVNNTSSNNRNTSTHGSSTSSNSSSTIAGDNISKNPPRRENILRIPLPFPRLNLEAEIFIPEAQRIQQSITESVQHIVHNISQEPRSPHPTSSHLSIRGIRDQRSLLWRGGRGDKELLTHTVVREEDPDHTIHTSSQQSIAQESPPRTPPREQRANTLPRPPSKASKAEKQVARSKSKPKPKPPRAINNINRFSQYTQPQNTPTRPQDNPASEEFYLRYAAHAPRLHRDLLLKRKKNLTKCWSPN